MTQTHLKIKKEEIFIPTQDGWRISLSCFRSEKRVQDVPSVLLVHGLAANKKIWAYRQTRGLAPYLLQRGYEVWSVDLRGHGKSLPLAAPGVHWLLEDFVEHDLPTCINYIFEKKGQKPISLIGHSMGATISLLVLGNRPEIASKVAYCMAISPSYLVDSKNPLWVQFTLKVLLGMGGVRLARFLGYAPFRKFMGFMENEATSFATELGKWAHQKEWCSSKDGHTFWEDIRRVSCKVDFLCAKGDSLWGRVNGCRSLYETCQSPQKRFVILEEEIPLDKNIGHYDSIMGSVAHNYTLPYFKTLLEENHGTIC